MMGLAQWSVPVYPVSVLGPHADYPLDAVAGAENFRQFCPTLRLTTRLLWSRKNALRRLGR